MPIFRIIFLFVFLFASNNYLSAQRISKPDSAVRYQLVKDSLKGMEVTNTNEKKKHIPRLATIRSAIIPGWGQAYNHEYWKIPIVWAAIGVPIYTFFYNDSYYKKTSSAYSALYAYQYGDTNNASVKANYNNIDPELKKLDLYSLQVYRNSFRKDRDYSILWFFILWGVNVVDATVFAHLKDFDVSNDLSLHITPNLNSTTGAPSLSLALVNKKKEHKLSSLALKY
jgi:hypothetical protein